jgi:hypothetical protein
MPAACVRLKKWAQGGRFHSERVRAVALNHLAGVQGLGFSVANPSPGSSEPLPCLNPIPRSGLHTSAPVRLHS